MRFVNQSESGEGKMVLKVLVTGGAGYIGSHTARELIRRGYEVVVLDTLEYGSRYAVRGMRLVQGDIADKKLVQHTFQQEKPDAVMHFAAYKAPGESMLKPTLYFRNNVFGTLSLLDGIVQADIRYCIFSSSCSIFGSPEQLPVKEDTPLSPESVYGETKLMGETLLKWFDAVHNLKYVSLRYFNASGASLDNVIGEDWSLTSNLIPLVMKAALGKVPSVKVFGTDYPTPDVTAIRDYIHVVDLAVAHVVALEHGTRTHQRTAYN